MSLYILGSIGCDLTYMKGYEVKLKELCNRFDMIVSFDSLDHEDRQTLAEAMGAPDSKGLYFAIYSGGGESDATVLWLEASDLAMQLLRSQGIDPLLLTPSQLEQTEIPENYYDDILSSRLGRFVSELPLILEGTDFEIAFIDGAVERIRYCHKNECLRQILRSFILPWDQTQNALYVFRRQ